MSDPDPALDRRISVLRDFASVLSAMLPGPPCVHAELGYTVRAGQQVRVLLSHPGGRDELARAFVPWSASAPCVLSVLGDRVEAASSEGLEEAFREALADGALLAMRMSAWRSVLGR